MDDYREVNRANWDERAGIHAASSDYGVERFVADPHHLSDVVRFDRPRLGEVRGLRGIHLQCHIGTDTVSLSRLGARMSGLDLSGESIRQARLLAARAGEEVDFVQAEVYDAPKVLRAGAFDLVYTGVGALCWLPDVAAWAEVVATLLRPGGRLFMREGHPVLWALDDARPDRLLALEHPYFETLQPTVWHEDTTYVATQQRLVSTTTHEWNHGLDEIVSALLAAGMEPTGLVEHDSVPWEALIGQMDRLPGGEWRVSGRPERLPHSYTLQGRRRG